MKCIISGGNITIGQENWNVWGNDTDKRLFKEILFKTHEQMNAILSHHGKVLILRFDFRISVYTEGNEIISDYFRIVKRQLQRHYKTKKIGHIWVREQDSSDKQHYHCVLMIDANKVRHPSKIIERLNMISDTHNLLPPYIPKNCYYIVQRNDYTAFSEAFYRVSYLAKVKTKQQRSGANNDYSTSRIPIK